MSSVRLGGTRSDPKSLGYSSRWTIWLRGLPGRSGGRESAWKTDFRLVRRPRDQATCRTIAGFGTLRTGKSNLFSAPLKTGLFGRLGRLFQTHLGTEATYAKNSDRTADQLSKFKAGVLGVPSEPAIKPHRPLNERERVILSKVEAENESPDFRSTANVQRHGCGY